MALANQTLKYTHVLIQPTNVDDEGQKSKAVDLTSGLQFTNYYESLTSPVITILMRCRFPMDVVNALPIRGGEMIAIELETLAGTFKFGSFLSDFIDSSLTMSKKDFNWVISVPPWFVPSF